MAKSCGGISGQSSNLAYQGWQSWRLQYFLLLNWVKTKNNNQKYNVRPERPLSHAKDQKASVMHIFFSLFLLFHASIIHLKEIIWDSA